MLRIDRLRVTGIRDRFVYARNVDAGAGSRAVKFPREDWPLEPDDVIAIEYDLERQVDGERPELVDVAFIRVFDDSDLEVPVAAE